MRLHLLVVATLLSPLFGCTRTATPGTRHLFDEMAQEVFDPAAVAIETTVRELTLPGRTVPDGPNLNPPLAIVPLEGIASEELAAVEVDVGDMTRGQLRLDWNRPADGEPCGLIVQGEHARPRPDGTRLFRFELVDSPCWGPGVTRLVLATGQRHRAHVAPMRLRLIARTLDPTKVEGAVWGVALGDELRAAVVLTGAVGWSRDVEISSGDHLDLAVGLKGGLGQPAELIVEAQRRGQPPQELARIECEPPRCREAWHDVRIALDALDAGPWTLRARLREPLPGSGFGFLAHPTLVNRGAGDERPNVVLVIVDTLRADHLSLAGYPLPTSPHLDRWAAANAVIFEQAIAPAPTTLPSHASLFTGFEATRHGANHDAASPELTLLAERLRGAGYATAAATGGGYLHPRYGLFQGFDRYRYFLAGHLREDELSSNLPAVLAWLDELPRPYFVLLHTYEVHGPYRPRSPYLERLHPESAEAGTLVWLEAEPPIPDEGYRVRRRGRYVVERGDAEVGRAIGVDDAIARYDSSIAYVDASLEKVFERLGQPDLAGDTAVVVTSDHGEAFGESDHAGHGYLLESNLRVPLLLARPDRVGAGTRVPRQVRTIDLMPTLLELTRLEIPADLDAASLLPLTLDSAAPHPDQAFSWAANTNYGMSLRLGQRAKVTVVDAVPPPYHLDTTLVAPGDDPQEQVDLAPTQPDIVARALRDLRARLESAGGTHLRLRSEAPVELLLSGASVGGTTTKSLDPCACSMTPGGLLIRLDPAQSVELLLEGPPRGDLSLSAPGGARSWTARPDELTKEPRVVHCGEAGCGLDGGPARVEVWQLGPGRSTHTSAAEPELLQQLQALGYVH